MNKKEYESHEDLIEMFMYNVRREKLHHLGSDTIKPSYLEQLGMSGLIFLIS